MMSSDLQRVEILRATAGDPARDACESNVGVSSHRSLRVAPRDEAGRERMRAASIPPGVEWLAIGKRFSRNEHFLESFLYGLAHLSDTSPAGGYERQMTIDRRQLGSSTIDLTLFRALAFPELRSLTRRPNAKAAYPQDAAATVEARDAAFKSHPRALWS